MPDWNSPEEVLRDSRVFSAFVLALCGLATWDVLKTFFPFDWSIISGQRRWRWPMILYFISRVCMLIHVWSLSFNLNAIEAVNCQTLVYVSKTCDAMGTSFSSIILALRTFAVWQQDKRVGAALLIGTVGQIAVWAQTFRYSVSRWDTKRNRCAVISTAPNSVIIAVFSYTVGFDLMILLLCAYKLANHEGIGALLLRDGMIYFVAATSANLLQTIMASLRLNPVMNIMMLPFALVVSVIAATTVFRNIFSHHNSFSSRVNLSDMPTIKITQAATPYSGRAAPIRGARSGSLGSSFDYPYIESSEISELRDGMDGVTVSRASHFLMPSVKG